MFYFWICLFQYSKLAGAAFVRIEIFCQKNHKRVKFSLNFYGLLISRFGIFDQNVLCTLFREVSQSNIWLFFSFFFVEHFSSKKFPSKQYPRKSPIPWLSFRDYSFTLNVQSWNPHLWHEIMAFAMYSIAAISTNIQYFVFQDQIQYLIPYFKRSKQCLDLIFWSLGGITLIMCVIICTSKMFI